MSPIILALTCLSRRFPRASGDEPVGDLALPGHERFSPRERG